MQDIRKSTETKVRVGPVVANGDAVTPVTDLTLSGADQAELLKHNGAATVDISAATFAAVTGCDGYYDLTITTSHSDTVGLMDIVIQDADKCVPFRMPLMVMNQNAYDANYGDGSVKLEVNATKVNGTAQTAGDIAALVNALNNLSAAQVNAEVDTAIQDALPAGASLIAGAGTTATDLDDISGGGGDASAANQTTIINALATVDGIVDAIKAVTDNLPDSGALSSLALEATLTAIKGATWNGTTDTLENIFDNLGGGGGGDATEANQTTILANLATIAGYLDTEIASILEDTGTTIPALIAALENINTAQVQSSCEAAIDAHVITELDGMTLDEVLTLISGCGDNNPSVGAGIGTLTVKDHDGTNTIATKSYTVNDDGVITSSTIAKA